MKKFRNIKTGIVEIVTNDVIMEQYEKYKEVYEEVKEPTKKPTKKAE